MDDRTSRAPFNTLHPAFTGLFFLSALILTMATVHPVFIVISVAFGIAENARTQGARVAMRSLAWQLPLFVVIVVLNPVFSMNGSTELLRIGHWALYAESLAYGACMAGLLIATIQWFLNAAHALSSDKILMLTGKVMPTIGLVLTMTIRLVSQFVRRGRHLSEIAQACTAARMPSTSISSRVRQFTVLAGWGLEDSLDTADAMRARGWGVSTKRTSYSRRMFRSRDAIATGALILLVALCAACAVQACGRFSFYPTLGSWAPWVFYLPHALLLSLPLLSEVLAR